MSQKRLQFGWRFDHSLRNTCLILWYLKETFDPTNFIDNFVSKLISAVYGELAIVSFSCIISSAKALIARVMTSKISKTWCHECSRSAKKPLPERPQCVNVELPEHSLYLDKFQCTERLVFTLFVISSTLTWLLHNSKYCCRCNTSTYDYYKIIIYFLVSH